MLPHPLSDFEIQKCYQNEPKFNGVFNIKDGKCGKNLDDYKSIGAQWIVLYVNAYNITYFDSFWVEHILKTIKNS